MSEFSSQSIMLRKFDHGDYDIILKLITRDNGKVSAIAKSAKKSVKRFAGTMELFSLIDAVYTSGKKKGLLILKEASLIRPFIGIRGHVEKTAYASYWAELVNQWVEEGSVQEEIFDLLHHSLAELEDGDGPIETLSIIFQIRFMSQSGFMPNLITCGICGKPMESVEENRMLFDISKGSLVCRECRPQARGNRFLSKGTVKLLLWIESKDLPAAMRIRLSETAQKEGLAFLESFVPYYLGRNLKTLNFLKTIRGSIGR